MYIEIPICRLKMIINSSLNCWYLNRPLSIRLCRVFTKVMALQCGWNTVYILQKKFQDYTDIYNIFFKVYNVIEQISSKHI